MKKGTLRKWTACLVTVILAISLFAIPAFAADETTKKETFWTVGNIVALSIAAAIVIAAVVLCIIFREKVQKFLRVYKSEVQKITWLSWTQTLKSSYVVVVLLGICAAAICLLDIGLFKGFDAFINLF